MSFSTTRAANPKRMPDIEEEFPVPTEEEFFRGLGAEEWHEEDPAHTGEPLPEDEGDA